MERERERKTLQTDGQKDKHTGQKNKKRLLCSCSALLENGSLRKKCP